MSCVLTMGSPILHADKIKFKEKYKCSIIEVWGNSEGLGTITCSSDLFTHPNSIGRPFFTDYLDVDYEISSCDFDNQGVLYGDSDNKFTEYIGKKELTASVLHNGFIYSEDIGYKDNDGYFYLTGRKTDIIVINGLKVFPINIETELRKNDKILDCAIVGVLDDNNNDRIVSILVMKGLCSTENVIKEINRNLAPHEQIQAYILIDKIPRNHGGKVDKTILKKIIAEKNMRTIQ